MSCGSSLHRQSWRAWCSKIQWYRAGRTDKRDGFFRILQSGYKNEDSPFSTDVCITAWKTGFVPQVEITMGKYQEPLLHLGKAGKPVLQAWSAHDRRRYVEYTCFYDMVANLSRCRSESRGGRLRLMKNVWWGMTRSAHADRRWYRRQQDMYSS